MKDKVISWSSLGKLSLLVGLIWGSIQIYQFLKSDGLKLTAYYNQINYELPIYVEDELANDDLGKFYDFLMDSILPEPNEATALVYFKIRQYQNFLEKDKSSILSIPKNYLTVLEISNDNNKKVKNLSINFETDGYYQYKKPDGRWDYGKFQNIIPIENLNAQNNITVYIWFSYLSSFNSNFTITYDEGITYPKEKILTSGFYLWCYKHLNSWHSLLIIIPFLFAIFSTIQIIVLVRENRKKNKSDLVQTLDNKETTHSNHPTE